MGFVELETLHERLTKLLMDNGAAVTKKSIDALLDFITNRDIATANHIVKLVDGAKQELIREVNTGRDNNAK